MSGKRQHFVPQFLQRPFASREDGKSCLTYVYSKYKPPFESSTRNVGVGNYFYSKPDDTFLDDLITEAEQNRYSSLVNKIRSSGKVVKDDQLEIAELLSHLEIRSGNLRESLRSTSSILIDPFLILLHRKKI